VIGNSLTAGTREWANRRQKEQDRSKNLFGKIQNGEMPHSLGQYGRNGIKTYQARVSAPKFWSKI